VSETGIAIFEETTDPNGGIGVWGNSNTRGVVGTLDREGSTQVFLRPVDTSITYNAYTGGVLMDETTRHTIKISTEALTALRILAAYTGKRQHVILEHLILDAFYLTER
jgi:hypothetical protein